MNPYKPVVSAPDPEKISKITDIFNRYSLSCVCEKAACPNKAECYANGSTTFMILGDICTRSCRFCNIKTGKPKPPDPTEPHRLALAIKDLGLRYVVITSVDRDDLSDYGAGHFSECVTEIKRISPRTKIELLTPDFKADPKTLDLVISAGADKLAHNQESVRRISAVIRPQSDYDRSLETLSYYATYSDKPVKSSLMAGLGESEEELVETMKDLRDAGVVHLTVGQYLQPTGKHHPVIKYHDVLFFKRLREIALSIGFKTVLSGALVRSSYYAHIS